MTPFPPPLPRILFLEGRGGFEPQTVDDRLRDFDKGELPCTDWPF